MTEAAYLRLVDEHMRATATGVATALGTSVDEVGLRCGKRVRPRLVHACAEALDLSPDVSAPWATLVEMIHMASLVHDDVIDGATLRRGRASIAARDGNRSAILAGDLLVSSAWLSASRDLPREVTGLLASAMIAMTTAELRERDLVWNPDATLGDYFDVIDGKTAALFSVAMEGTAVLAGTSPTTREGLASFGRRLGQTFQMLDDVRDYQLAQDASDKESLKDLKEGVATLPLIIALRSRSRHAAEVRSYLASRGATAFDAGVARRLLRETAALDRSLRLARRRFSSGVQALERVLPDPGLRRMALASTGWPEPGAPSWALSA